MWVWLVGIVLLLGAMAASPARSIRALDILLPAGQTNCVPIVLGGEGGETAITLSVCFDTNLLSYVSVQRGSDAGDASLSVNTIQASRGRVGVSLMRSDGATFPAGDKVLVEVCFRSTTANGIVTTPVAICETPVGRDILDADANSVASSYANATVTVVGNCSFQLRTNATSFSSGGGAGGVELVADAGCAWSAASLTAWITIRSGSSGSGTGSVGFEVALNPDYVARTGVVVIAGQTFTVTQAAVPCSFRLNLTERVHGPAAEFNFVDVSASSACRWTVANTNSWITITSGATSTGNGRLDYWVAANSAGMARTGTVVIAGIPFTVRQLGYPCSYALAPESRVHSAASEAAVLNVTAPDGCAWYVVNTNDWMIIKLYTNGVGNDIVRYTVFANPHPAARSGVLTVGGQPFTVHQIGAPCVYGLLETSRLYGPGPTYDTVSIATLPECSWTATSTNNWIVISTPGGTGGGVISFYVAPNWSSSDRKGSIQIANRIFVVSQLGTPCSYSITPTSRSISAGINTGLVSISTSITSGTGSSNQTCHWTALNTNSWITVYQPLDPTNKGLIRYSVAANDVGGSRSGVLVVAGQSFTITQAGLPCTYSLSPTSRSHGYEVETGLVTVTGVNGCLWTAATTDPWIGIVPPLTSVGSGAIQYRLQPNFGPARTGRITIGTAVFMVNQAAAAPVAYVRQPVSQQVAWGTIVSFNVSVSGTPPFTYQWLFNGIDLQESPDFSGVFTPTLIVQNVQPANSGSYSVLVSNRRGPLTSAPAQLTVNTPPRLNPIPGRSTVRGSPITFTATATDLQAPPQRFTYSLAPGAPIGSSINAVSGIFLWTPPPTQPIGGYPVTVRVTDNGVPPISDELTTTISVFDGYTTNITLIATGSVWKYRDTGENLGTAWNAPGFDDSLWGAGPAKLGYGNGDERTTVGFGPNATAKYITTYFRTRFGVSESSTFSLMNLRLLRDDGAVVYLNGTEIFRDNMPAGPINYLTLASLKIGAVDETAYVSSPPLDPAVLVRGENVVAVEIHQNTVGSSDIGMDMALTGTLTVVTAGADLSLAPASVPRVRIGPGPDGGARLSWETLPARRYRVEYTTDMSAPAWSTLGGELIATSYSAEIADDPPGVLQRFYRVLMLP